MRTYMLLLGLPLAGLMAGCQTPAAEPNTGPTAAQDSAANGWMVNSIRDAAINNALLTQHTLFPYHFVTDQAGLNELGRRDLGALVIHFRAGGGELNVRRGGASEELYQARVATVAKLLGEAGIESGRVRIGEALAGGAGMASEEVVRILQADRQAKPFSGNESASDIQSQTLENNK